MLEEFLNGSCLSVSTDMFDALNRHTVGRVSLKVTQVSCQGDLPGRSSSGPGCLSSGARCAAFGFLRCFGETNPEHCSRRTRPAAKHRTIVKLPSTSLSVLVVQRWENTNQQDSIGVLSAPLVLLCSFRLTEVSFRRLTGAV